MNQLSNSTSNASSSENQSAAGNLRRGGSTFDNIKTAVADKLKTVASSLHEKAGQRSGQNDSLSGYGHQAAEWLDNSADYVRDLDPQKLKGDIENSVRRNPGRSLLIAGAAGLALGALLRRR